MKEMFESFTDWITDALFWPFVIGCGALIGYEMYKGKTSYKGSALERGVNDNIDFVKSSLKVSEKDAPKRDMAALTKDVASPKDVAGGADVRETSAPVRVAAAGGRETAASQLG